MVNKKKKILFDVFDVVQHDSETLPARLPSRGRAVTTGLGDRGRAGEVPPGMRRGLVASVAAVAVVFLGLAYWFGLVHGEKGGDGPRRLRSTTGESERPLGREEMGRHFAVRAVEASYNAYTFESRKSEFGEYVRLLNDRSYEPVDVWDYPSEKQKGCGRLVIWVGQGTSQRALEDLTTEIRALTLRGHWPFELAVPALFVDSLGN